MSEFTADEFQEREGARILVLRNISATLAEAGVPVQHRDAVAMRIWSNLAEFPGTIRLALDLD